MNLKDKLTEATIQALNNKRLTENKITVKFIDDYVYDNTQDAINDFTERATDLQLDGLEQLSQLAYEVIDRLENGETNIVISDDEINQANEFDTDYNDIEDNTADEITNKTNSYYDEENSKLFDNYYDEFVEYGIGNRYNPDEYAGKKFRMVRSNQNNVYDEYELVDEFPSVDDLFEELDRGNLIVLNSDYVIGNSNEVVSTYVQYGYDRTNPYVNYYNFNKHIKQQISQIRNGNKPYLGEIMYVGTDLTDEILYDNNAKSQFAAIYNKLLNSDNFNLYVFYL